jgi:cell division protein FtsW
MTVRHASATSAASTSAASSAFSGASSPLSLARRVKAVIPARILGPRLLLILTTILLLVFGLVMVYSASFVEAFTNPEIQDGSFIFRRQLLLVGLGLCALIVTAVVDYRVWDTFASWIPWALIVVLLFLTMLMGNEELGGKRWFDLFGFNLQPSEFAKVALLLLVGMLLVKLRQSRERTSIMVLIAVAIAVPTLLILCQPDLGTTLIVLAGIIAVAWFGELPMKPLAIAIGLIVLVAAAAILFAGFRVERIDAWLDPWAHASGGGYQIVNSFYAFADGGVTGVGLGMSHQKYLYLPQPYNDLIFPIIGEEFGLIGAVAVVVLFMLFLYAAYRIARGASDLYGRVIAGASATVIGFQAFLNMLCMVNLLPMTGKPLPFFSAGGSSIIVTLMLVGLILNVSFRSRLSSEANQRRDDLLIIKGGRNAVQDGSLGDPAGWSPFGKRPRQQPARLVSSAASGSRPREAPVRAPVNPMLNMSPARNRGRGNARPHDGADVRVTAVGRASGSGARGNGRASGSGARGDGRASGNGARNPTGSYNANGARNPISARNANGARNPAGSYNATPFRGDGRARTTTGARIDVNKTFGVNGNKGNRMANSRRDTLR